MAWYTPSETRASLMAHNHAPSSEEVARPVSSSPPCLLFLALLQCGVASPRPIETTRHHETAWRMLSTMAEKASDLPHETLR
jgi:hypothetical protein